MSMQDKLNEDLKDALRAGDAVRRETIRLVRSAIHYAEIEKGRPLNDDEVVGVIGKQARQREESMVEFQRGGRQDLVDKEAAELAILRTYLPQPLSRDEIETLARRIVAETGASGPGDIGKVMPRLMEAVRGRADGRQVSAIVAELLRR